MSKNVIQNYLKKMFGEVETDRREVSTKTQPMQSAMATSILTPKSVPNDILNSFLRGRK